MLPTHFATDSLLRRFSGKKFQSPQNISDTCLDEFPLNPKTIAKKFNRQFTTHALVYQEQISRSVQRSMSIGDPNFVFPSSRSYLISRLQKSTSRLIEIIRLCADFESKKGEWPQTMHLPHVCALVWCEDLRAADSSVHREGDSFSSLSAWHQTEPFSPTVYQADQLLSRSYHLFLSELRSNYDSCLASNYQPVKAIPTWWAGSQEVGWQPVFMLVSIPDRLAR